MSSSTPARFAVVGHLVTRPNPVEPRTFADDRILAMKNRQFT
jgi:hypothetical protein